MSQTFVTLRSFQYPSDAHPIQARLESEGIKTFLEGGETIAADPFLSNAIGGVLLKIAASDAERALEVMGQFDPAFNKSLAEEPAPKVPGFTSVDAYCPSCDARLVYRRKIPVPMLVLAVLFMPLSIPFLFMRKKHYCVTCQHEWKQ